MEKIAQWFVSVICGVLVAYAAYASITYHQNANAELELSRIAAWQSTLEIINMQGQVNTELMRLVKQWEAFKNAQDKKTRD